MRVASAADIPLKRDVLAHLTRDGALAIAESAQPRHSRPQRQGGIVETLAAASAALAEMLGGSFETVAGRLDNR